MQMKTTIRYHLIAVRTAIIKMPASNKCWRGYEPSYTVGGDVNCWNHSENQYGGSSKN